MRKLNVLSLFDGCAGARQALKELGIECNYYASEIDKYAISVAKKNHPDIIHIGDVKDVRAGDLPPIDLLVGGSPCQNLSRAGNGKGLEGEQSSLFYEYLRLKKELKPKHFLLENVASMKKADRDIITSLMCVSPIMINSALLSAQNRKRYYWADNSPLCQPMDKGILLKDILEDEVDEKYYLSEKASKGMVLRKHKNKEAGKGFGANFHTINDKKTNTIPAQYYKDGSAALLLNQVAHLGKNRMAERVYDTDHKSRSITANGGGMGAKTGLYAVAQRGRNIVDGKRKDEKGAKYTQRLETSFSEKSNCLSTVQKDSMVLIHQRAHGHNKGGTKALDGKTPTLTQSAWGHNNLLLLIKQGIIRVRRLTPLECTRLQTLPDGYTSFGVDINNKEVVISDTQQYKMVGNGFTIAVIKYLLMTILHEYLEAAC